MCGITDILNTTRSKSMYYCILYNGAFWHTEYSKTTDAGTTEMNVFKEINMKMSTDHATNLNIGK